MRERPVSLDQFQIDKWGYYELKAFSRQYDRKKEELRKLPVLSSPPMTGMSRTNIPGKPTERIAMKRMALETDVRMIEEAAMQVEDGRWFEILIDSCCRGIPYEKLDQTRMPSSQRSAFFRARRTYFYLLHRLREGGA